MRQHRKAHVVLLSGGVGGARMAQGFAGDVSDLTVIVNVGDDASLYGVHVAADLDTVMYTLAGIEGPNGWGRANDSFVVMEALTALGIDTSFRLGDADLATCLARTQALASGRTLSDITAQLCKQLSIDADLLPATDDPLRTRIRTAEGWLDFQDYFVMRAHRDIVRELDFTRSADAKPAPGVIERIDDADLVVIAPSNPPLSIWPILAIDEVHDAVRRHPRVVAVSPLFSGKAVKGPTAEVMAAVQLSAGNVGIVEAYDGLLNGLVIDLGDAGDATKIDLPTLAADTRIGAPEPSRRLAAEILAWRL